MGYFLGALWCIAFTLFGLFLAQQRRKYASYPSFIAKVEAVKTMNGRHVAIMRSNIAEVGSFHISYQDLGDFNVGQSVECIWDGKKPGTAQQDLRDNQKTGIAFSFLMVVVMAVGMVVASAY